MSKFTPVSLKGNRWIYLCFFNKYAQNVNFIGVIFITNWLIFVMVVILLAHRNTLSA